MFKIFLNSTINVLFVNIKQIVPGNKDGVNMKEKKALKKSIDYAKWTVLDLVVTRYYLFLRDGIVTRKFKFGKTEIVESNIRKKLF